MKIIQYYFKSISNYSTGIKALNFIGTCSLAVQDPNLSTQSAPSQSADNMSSGQPAVLISHKTTKCFKRPTDLRAFKQL
jgi:hypothetical protein